MTATQNYDNIIPSTPILSADPNVKEDVMTDQQKITILYYRLSNEDSQDGESNSIQNQRELLTRYAQDHGYTNLKVLVDDGHTGTNFQRPGVQEGFELVKQGLVGCWLCKDLSRFGRDYLTVGQYTDIIFPIYDVRFIAVNDGVDSQRGDGEGFAAIRNLFNEWYPRDTSKKVRISLHQRGTSGKHLGKPPYGYRCDSNDKDKWILDEEAAPVVKRIFDLCIDGKGPEQISRILERDQVLTTKAPLYASRKGKPLPKNPYGWKDQSIVGILRHSGTECRSCAKTSAAPQKRNGRDCSPGCCIAQTAVASSTLPPARALRANRITTSAPNIRVGVAIARRIISARMYCGSWCWNGFRRSTSTFAVMWRAFRRNGCTTAAPIRNGTSGKIRSAWSRQKSALPPSMWSCPGSMRTTLSVRSAKRSTRK